MRIPVRGLAPVVSLVVLGACGGGGGGGGGAAPASTFQPVPLDAARPVLASTNPIDSAAGAVLRRNGIDSARLADDGEFLRRVTSDVVGRPPTLEEMAEFAKDAGPDKRIRLVDRLLGTREFAEHWARDVIGPWCCVGESHEDFDRALELDISMDVPIAEIFQRLAQGAGVEGQLFDKEFPRAYEKVDQLMLTFAGMTSQCARCHDHPHTRPGEDPAWTQDENYGLYAFFAQNSGDATKVDRSGKKFGRPVEPRFAVDGAIAAVPSERLPRLADPLPLRRARFGELLAGSDAFARGFAHRIWAEVTAPLLDPNNFLQVNLAAVTAPEVLAELARTFRAENTSLKRFLRVVLNSGVYQLSADGPAGQDHLLARHVLRRQNAEVVGSAIAVALAHAPARDRELEMAFGYPLERRFVNERRNVPNVGQAALLLNGSQAAGRVRGSPLIGKLADEIAKGELALDVAVATLFKAALTREPTPGELQAILAEAAGAKDERELLEDVAAALESSVEFVVK